jgi:hypothetical protein
LVLFKKKSKQFWWTVISLVIIIPLGFYSKFYIGPWATWVNDSLAGGFYVIFWILLVFLLFPKLNPVTVASWVFLITCGLEFLQLWHPPFLEYLRHFFLGQVILGTSFAWPDFSYYFFGSIIGWFWLLQLNKLK